MTDKLAGAINEFREEAKRELRNVRFWPLSDTVYQLKSDLLFFFLS